MPREPAPPPLAEPEDDFDEEEEPDMPDAETRTEIHPTNLFQLAIDFWRAHRPDSTDWPITVCLQHMIQSGEYIPASVWAFPESGMMIAAANQMFQAMKAGHRPSSAEVASVFQTGEFPQLPGGGH